MALAGIAGACSSFEDGALPSTSDDAGIDRTAPPAPEGGGDTVVPADGGADAAQPDGCVVLDCKDTVYCDDFTRETPERGAFALTSDSSKMLQGDAGIFLEDRECGSKALVVFMPTANNEPGERMLSIPTTALLDTLTAEMDVWIDTDPGTYTNDHSNTFFIVGDPGEIGSNARLAGLRYQKSGLVAFDRHYDRAVEKTTGIALRQWVHVTWRIVFSDDADAGQITVTEDGATTIDVRTPTLYPNTTPRQGFSVFLGLRNSGFAGAMTLKIDNVRLSR